MDSIAKRQTTNDRISNLPDNLISHILSFLPTKDVVRTSALSTLWNQQWTSVVRLDFDDGLKFGSGYATYPSSFVNIVYRVLLSNVTLLELFKLKCGLDYGATHFCDWISAALSRNVRQIDVNVFMDKCYCIQLDCLFSSRTLVLLKLGRGFLLILPTVITFDNLKILHLNLVEFEDGESLSKLISSCPSLEELKLEAILSESMHVVNISSLSLKRLILNELLSFWVHFLGERHLYEIVLNTPRLQYLEYYEDHCLPDGYKIETLQCLDKACMRLSLSADFFDRHLYYPDLSSVANLFLAISNVRFLCIPHRSLEGFSYCCSELHNELPNFPRLIDLEIGGICLYGESSLLKAFLQNSPQLATLSFSLGSYVVWDPPTIVPICMQCNLKVVKVKCFSGRKLELSVVKYFLEKTNCLKELSLRSAPSMKEEKEQVIKNVLMLPRASKSCKIVLT